MANDQEPTRTKFPAPSISTDVLLRKAGLHLSGDAMHHLGTWLTQEQFADFAADIADLITREDWGQLEDSFYTVLPFGTGGRRGPRGPGPNRINRRTIAESARGLADWVLAQASDEPPSIAIACDTRHASDTLSRVCAEVVAAAGLTALIYPEFRPTPQLSFTVRAKRAGGGIVVSASHNPPSDNGFKAYGPDGGQISVPRDIEVMAAVSAASERSIPALDFDQGLASGQIRLLCSSDDDAYRNAVLTRSVRAERGARVVFTPLHGTGSVSVLPVLRKAGFRDIHVVESQSDPNGDFPNVANRIPNPEEPAAMAEAADLARRTDADIAIGTDPDADRIGCVAKRSLDASTSWAALTGNQIGAVLCHSVLDALSHRDRLPRGSLVLTTAVTSRLIGRIARRFGVALIEDLLVGFKYIAGVLRDLREPERVVFACEESHGYLSGAYTRDKDAANASLLMAEAAAHLRAEGRTVWDLLEELYATHGYFADILEPYVSSGKAGQQEIAEMLARMRAAPPTRLAGMDVTCVVDRLANTKSNGPAGSPEPLAQITDPVTAAPLPSLAPARDNLLILELDSNEVAAGARVAIRPSGTEPKCKFYCSVWTVPAASPAARQAAERQASALSEALRHAALMGT